MEPILTLTLNPAVDVAIEVDHLESQRKLRSPYARYDAGGGGINVARGIRRYGGEARALFTAGGAMGDLLTELVRREGVPHTAIAIAGMTRESFTVSVRQPPGLYRFVLPGPELTPVEAERCLAEITALSPLPRYWVASGSLPAGLGEDFYARLARLARQRQARLILDTSGPALAAAVEEGVYLLKPNAGEFAGLIGHTPANEDELRALARERVSRGGIEILVVSLGADGALLTAAGEQHLCRPPPVVQRSSVGAGDSFLALLTLKLAQGRPLEEALRYAVAAGTAAVTTPATELFHAEDVERLYRRLPEGS